MSTKVKTAGAAFIVVATLFAYWPAMHGQFIWDDPDYIVYNQTLRTLDGLREMWTNPRSLPQWYPMVHTTFWIEFQLWELNPLGYHIVNVLLHACNALLLWRVLAMLKVHGAWLAGAIFALHPVHAESVAWITERKNVLSLFFYLLAMVVYLKFIAPTSNAGTERTDVPDRIPWERYLLALALFAAALFSKTVTASLPAALLLIIWWKMGRLRWRDLVPLIPLFVIGIVLALQTAHLEQARVGARGAEWQHAEIAIGDFLARTIIAGKALWFYLYKLVCPISLAFIYERWKIDWRDPVQYLYPVTFLAAIFVLWAARFRIGRGPLVAVLFFAGTLFPALGFLNVFPHRYSFVADHFQYHASVGLIALAAGVLAHLPRSIESTPARIALAMLLLAPLATLTFLQSRIYADPETLWRDAVAKSPNNWMAWTNLGNALAAQKRVDEAIECYEIALNLAPDVYDVQYNAGIARAREGSYEQAEQHFRRSVEIMPTFVPGWEALGDLYADELNDADRAIDSYRRALEIAPYRTETQHKLQRLLARRGRSIAS